MPNKNQIARALVVKELWERAVFDAHSSNETSWIGAAMIAGVAVETALKSALAAFASQPKDKNLNELIEEFERTHPDKITKQDVQAAHQLRALRNGVQHGGTIPAQRAVVRAVVDAEAFLTNVVKVAFDVELRAVRHIDLIDDPVLRTALEAAYERVETSKLADALALAGACYEQMRFRLSAEGVTIRSPDKGQSLAGYLPSRPGLLSGQVLTSDVGVAPQDLILGEVDLADNANRLLAQATLGMSAAWLARMEMVRDIMTKHREDFAAAMKTEQLDGCNAEVVESLLDYLTRQVWRLEETQPELFGLGWRAWVDDAAGED